MGRISKLDIGRLESRRFELQMDCPNCGSARIKMSVGNGSGSMKDVDCPKCGVHIILDGLSITMINDAPGMEPKQALESNQEIRSTGSIL